jgi:hypothetical protein
MNVAVFCIRRGNILQVWKYFCILTFIDTFHKHVEPRTAVPSSSLDEARCKWEFVLNVRHWVLCSFLLQLVNLGCFRAGYLQVFRFPLKIIIPPNALYSSIIRGWYNRSIRGRRTKYVKSNPTRRNKKKILWVHDNEILRIVQWLRIAHLNRPSKIDPSFDWRQKESHLPKLCILKENLDAAECLRHKRWKFKVGPVKIPFYHNQKPNCA